MEVFVRRDRAAAAGCAVTAGGDGAAVTRLWAKEEWWREWWSGAMKAAVVVIRSRRCFGGRVYSGSLLLPKPELPCAASAGSGPQPITRVQIYRTTLLTRELLLHTTPLSTSFWLLLNFLCYEAQHICFNHYSAAVGPLDGTTPTIRWRSDTTKCSEKWVFHRCSSRPREVSAARRKGLMKELISWRP